MDSLDEVKHSKFEYVFIPREPLDEVQVLEFEGLERDFKDKLLLHFSHDALLNSEREELAHSLTETFKSGEVPQGYIDRAVETSKTYQIIPLTLPTPKNNYDGVNLYIDSISRIKNLPTNCRASRIAGTDIRGDCFISRTFDDEVVFKRLDFTLDDFNNFLENPPSSANRWDQTKALAQLQQISSDNPNNDFSKSPEYSLHCANCHKTDMLKNCSRCKKVFYCSIACQKEDWSFHKRICTTS